MTIIKKSVKYCVSKCWDVSVTIEEKFYFLFTTTLFTLTERVLVSRLLVLLVVTFSLCPRTPRVRTTRDVKI